jgi:tetratricopeptide (TPR) repeat protein
MGKHFVPEDPRTPADEIRRTLEEAEIMMAGLHTAGSDLIELLRILDSVSEGLAKLDALGVDVRPERNRFETVQRRLVREKRRFVAKVGGALEKERAAIQPDRERQWWYLDEMLAEERRTRLRRFLTWGAAVLGLLVALGVLYNIFLAPSPETRRSYRHSLAGERLASEGDLASALAEFEAAIELRPDDPEHLVWIGVLRSKLDRPDAETAFEAAQNIFGAGGDFLLTRARVYRTIGDLEMALADLEQAMDIDPKSGWLYYERALVHQAMGNRDAAVDDLMKADELAGEAGDDELVVIARYQRALLSMSPPEENTPAP